MCAWLYVEREGARLACRDFGGTGPTVLFLHGLAGHSGEWASVAEGLRRDFRVVALDQRGHGRSERNPADLSRAAYVDDVTAAVSELGLGPVALVGQSMGGNTAFLTAARQPELVASLVVVEASPDGPSPELPGRISAWLDRWPVPFSGTDEARAFFSQEGLAPGPWSDGLEQREGGLWPPFDKSAIVGCVTDLASRDYRSEWAAIRCPTLIVRGEAGHFDAEHTEQLARSLPHGRAVTIAKAGHDLHLDTPRSLTRELRRFLAWRNCR